MFDDFEVEAPRRPRPSDVTFDLDRALASVLALEAAVPPDAFTAQTLGTERVGNAVLIREDGLALTIGYLITEAEEVSLTTVDGRIVQAHVLGQDAETGFGLVHALEPLGVPAIAVGDSRSLAAGDAVVVAGGGGRAHALSARVAARQAFAGYWEYVLDDAIFTAPAHPHWSGAALIGGAGELVGIGSLHLEREGADRRSIPSNMSVPTELLSGAMDRLLTVGAKPPARPWLGLFAQEIDGRVVAVGFAGPGPAKRAGLNEGDAILAVAGHPVRDLAGFYRRVWALGDAGADVPLTLDREGDVFNVTIASMDRRRLLKAPLYH